MSNDVERTAPAWHQASWILVASVCTVAACWILGNPRSAGPDEPSHMVMSAALVRGDRDGEAVPDDESVRVFEVPAMVGAPDPGCWAFHPEMPVDCANETALEATTAERGTTAFNYAPWTYPAPGLASLVSWPGGYAYLARALNALIPTALIAWSLIVLRRQRPLLALAALAGATPIVWFTLGTVNPSAVAIVGGLALWAGLLVSASPSSRNLAIVGWAGVLLARRDGPLWATMIVLACCILLHERPRDLWNRLGRRARWIPLALAPLPLLSVLERGQGGFNRYLALVTLTLVVADVWIGWWTRHESRGERSALVGGTLLTVAVVYVLVVTQRPGGFNSNTLRLVMSNTGSHLQQLVGILGWLDAPVPTTAVFLFWAIVGGLGAVALLEHRRGAFVFAGALGAAVVAAWTLELGQGANYGQYWQGRYTMPFAVGLPLVLTWRPTAGALVERLVVPLAGTSWIVLNLGFLASQRRWGVGINGSWNPLRWDTWGAPVPPLVVALVHGVATAAIAAIVLATRTTREPTPSGPST